METRVWSEVNRGTKRGSGDLDYGIPGEIQSVLAITGLYSHMVAK